MGSDGVLAETDTAAHRQGNRIPASRRFARRSGLRRWTLMDLVKLMAEPSQPKAARQCRNSVDEGLFGWIHGNPQPGRRLWRRPKESLNRSKLLNDGQPFEQVERAGQRGIIHRGRNWLERSARRV